MNSKKVFRAFGLLSLFMGIILLFNGFSGLTGFAVFEGIGRTASSILGLVFVILGAILALTVKRSESVLEAILDGVPAEDAERIYDESNKKASSGKWVPLMRVNAVSTSNPETYPQATSSCIYWGPREYIGCSRSALNRLYKASKVGKTHELSRGSDRYKQGGSLTEGTVSEAPTGARVLHRHWEIKEMYKYERENKNEKDYLDSIIM